MGPYKTLAFEYTLTSINKENDGVFFSFLVQVYKIISLFYVVSFVVFDGVNIMVFSPFAGGDQNCFLWFFSNSYLVGSSNGF